MSTDNSIKSSISLVLFVRINFNRKTKAAFKRRDSHRALIYETFLLYDDSSAFR